MVGAKMKGVKSEESAICESVAMDIADDREERRNSELQGFRSAETCEEEEEENKDANSSGRWMVDAETKRAKLEEYVVCESVVMDKADNESDRDERRNSGLQGFRAEETCKEEEEENKDANLSRNLMAGYEVKEMKLEEGGTCKLFVTDIAESERFDWDERRFKHREHQGFRLAETFKEEQENNDASSSGNMMAGVEMKEVKLEDVVCESVNMDRKERKYEETAFSVKKVLMSEVSPETDSNCGMWDSSFQPKTIVKTECDLEVGHDGGAELAGPSRESGCRAEHSEQMLVTASSMNIHSEEKAFACTICGYLCSESSQLKAHKKIHNGKKTFSCSDCDYICYCAYKLKRHMRTHTGEKPYACNECEYKCRQSGGLKAHMNTHTGKPFACNECHYKSSTLGSLKQHLRTHTGEKPFACEVCDFRCRGASGLIVHRRIHTEEKPYACEECGYKCRQSAHLKKHMKTHAREKSYTCEQYEYEYKSSDASILRSHMSTHTEDKFFACEECDYKCRQSMLLKKHMKTHAREKSYTCEQYEYEYKSSDASILRSHMSTHTGDKSFAGEERDYKCRQSINLKKHMKTRAREKSYTCEEYEYEFKSSDASILRSHMSTHTGDKSFACEERDCKCRQSGHSKTHSDIGENPFACTKYM